MYPFSPAYGMVLNKCFILQWEHLFSPGAVLCSQSIGKLWDIKMWWYQELNTVKWNSCWQFQILSWRDSSWVGGYIVQGVHWSVILHVAFNLPYVYKYTTKLCQQETKVTQNYKNEHVCRVGKGKARHRKYKRLKHGSGKAYNCSIN